MERGNADANYKIEQIIFHDGTEWDYSYISNHINYYRGSDENNTLDGSISDDIIYGNGGNDSINGGAGDDLLSGST